MARAKDRFDQVNNWNADKALASVEEELIDLVAQAREQLAQVVEPVCVPAHVGDCMLEISIPDLHAGKLAWGPETGHQPYDLKIAKADFETALAALLERTDLVRVGKILFVVGNDLLHSDNAQATTTGGTPQDTDSRYHKTFLMVRRLMVDAIQELKQIAPVEVVMVPGNHDTLAVWHLGDSLAMRFENDPLVTVNNDPTLRKYVQHGKVMLMFVHGHQGKHSDYPNVMAAEKPQMWGETVFREAHVGHRHQDKVEEFHGVKVVTIPSLSAADAWHSAMQYVGNGRSAESFLWSPSEGKIASAFYTVPLS